MSTLPEQNPTPEHHPGRGQVVVLTAPSGAGKTTIAAALLDEIPGLRFSVSATTRPPRPHEQDGVHYHFVSPEHFRACIEGGDLLEYEEVYPGRFYGTLRSEVERAAETGPVLLDIDVRGALNVKHLYAGRALTVFIRPPSLEALEKRLRARGTETAETLRVRLETARHEMTFAGAFDVVVVNDELKTAIAETLQHVRRFLTG